ncbi:NAD(P)-binding protein [Backusella circina FSU 941]|nr:NAD(P)-binding protein [Backusella circina FSU 941]
MNRLFTSKQAFQIKDIPDLTGKLAVITGASNGIGKVSALEMARKNCNIVFACRNREKTEAVIGDIKKETKNDNLEFLEIDMSSLSSVKRFVSEFSTKYDKVDILLNNGGVMMAPTPYSKDGIDYQFAVNHVAHHYLTMSLLPLLQRSPSSRVVNVASEMHRYTSKLGLDNINTDEHAGKIQSYGISKVANILFTRELAKRLKEQGIENVYVNCNHPGTVSTDIFRPGLETGPFISKFVTSIVVNYFTVTPEKGALTQLYLCTSPEVEENDIRAQYYVPVAKSGSPTKLASSDKEALLLWEFTENLLKEKIPGYSGANI